MQGFWLVSYIALWGMVLIEACAITALLRQIGVLHLRVQPMGARTMNAGPEIEDRLPELHAEDINGRHVSVVEHGRARLLVFMAPTCAACEELMPAVNTIARTEKDRLDVVLLTTVTDEKVNREFIEKHRLARIPYIASPAVVERIGVFGTPYALVTDADGVVRAKGLANHIEHLESLVEALSTRYATVESYVGATSGRGGNNGQER
jgi:methylamine dehydrogenase accessory protein MauD